MLVQCDPDIIEGGEGRHSRCLGEPWVLLAESGKLSDPETLGAQVDRMLNDRRSSRFCDNFPVQWLQLDRLITSVPDPKKYPGFYDGDGYRTTPGKFGAYASKLYALLQKGHYKVKLSDEDMHRIALWLDCSSMFYGVYEKEGGEAQLRGEIAMPTLE